MLPTFLSIQNGKQQKEVHWILDEFTTNSRSKIALTEFYEDLFIYQFPDNRIRNFNL